MKIEAYTYFEEVPKNGLGCQVAYGWHDENDVLQMNPPFISVINAPGEVEGVLYVENTHEYDMPDKTHISNGEYPFGFWRIKYKSL